VDLVRIRSLERRNPHKIAEVLRRFRQAAVTYRRAVLGRWRFALAPRWLALHLLVIAMAVAMVLLGRWQLDVSNAKHFSLQNFGYALQWWAFTVFALFLWVRLVRDAANARQGQITATTGDSSLTPSTGSAGSSPSADRTPSADPAPGYRRYVMPRVTDAAPTDDVHAAYNAYLAGLSGQSSPDASTDVPSSGTRQRGATGQSTR
jgi:hypothetical protein